jgi:hypothetical protein
MAAEQVGLRQFRRHPLLAGVDDLRGRGDGLDLGDVPGLDGVAEDDAHAGFSQPVGPRGKRKKGDLSPIP